MSPLLRMLRRSGLALLVAFIGTAHADEAGWSALQDGAIVLIRHARAPGTGDPAGMRLGDCSTQRNLDDEGRAQARRLGESFRRRNVRVAAVVTSPWCRTRETADLAFPGQAKEDPAFSSFFSESEQERISRTAEATQRLSGWKGPGVLVVVTHQGNITALTGIFPASGEAVVVRMGANGVRVVGRIDP